MADSSALPKPGDTVAAKYLIERAIGSGGMSVVFGATHRVTGKRFAIKWLLRDENTPGTEASARFIREAQVAGRFQHPNVVEIFDVGEVNGSFYMVMDWLEGESLATRLERGRLTLDDACRYLIPCMRGMDEAHAAGIVHRDLKPANIFICAATKHGPERAQVLDFGVAKLLDPSHQMASSLVTKAGMLIGTPYYLSPEQLRGQPVDARTDIYAFGVILYQVLSGQLPFPATTFSELVMQIAAGAPQPLRHLVPTLPVGVDELIGRAMIRDPAQRFQNLGGLIAALDHFSPGRTSESSHRDELVIVSDTRNSEPLPQRLSDSGMTPAPIVIDEPGPAKRSALLMVTVCALVLGGVLLGRQIAGSTRPVANQGALPASAGPAQPAPAAEPPAQTSRSAAVAQPTTARTEAPTPAAPPPEAVPIEPAPAPAHVVDEDEARSAQAATSPQWPSLASPRQPKPKAAAPGSVARPDATRNDASTNATAPISPKARARAAAPASQTLHAEPPRELPAEAPAAAERNPLDMRLQ